MVRLYENYREDAVRQPSESPVCHSEPFDKLPETTLGTGRTGSAKRVIGHPEQREGSRDSSPACGGLRMTLSAGLKRVISSWFSASAWKKEGLRVPLLYGERGLPMSSPWLSCTILLISTIMVPSFRLAAVCHFSGTSCGP